MPRRDRVYVRVFEAGFRELLRPAVNKLRRNTQVKDKVAGRAVLSDDAGVACTLPPEACRPCERTFNHPASRQEDEAGLGLWQSDHFKRDTMFGCGIDGALTGRAAACGLFACSSRPRPVLVAAGPNQRRNSAMSSATTPLGGRWARWTAHIGMIRRQATAGMILSCWNRRVYFRNISAVSMQS